MIWNILNPQYMAVINDSVTQHVLTFWYLDSGGSYHIFFLPDAYVSQNVIMYFAIVL